MKLKTKQINTDPETHQLIAIVDDEEIIFGTLRRKGPDRWKFEGSKMNNAVFQDAEVVLDVMGETIEEAATAFGNATSMTAIPIEKNRLDDDVICKMVERQLLAALQLADEANCHAGVIFGISRALAISIVEDIKEESQESFLTSFTEMTREYIAKRRQVNEVKSAFKELLETVMDKRETH